MFASQTTETITIGTHTVVVRKLSWKSIQSAAAKQQDEAFALMAKIPDAVSAKMDATRKASDPDPDAKYVMFHQGSVLQAGIVSIDGEKPTPAQIDDLTPTIATRIHRAIIDLTERESDSPNA